METYPVTLWFCTFGVGDGQDLASRGYIRALLESKYENVVISPRGTTIQHLDAPELAPFRDIIGYPTHLSPKLKRVEKGDPRIGKPWPHLDESPMPIPAPAHAPDNSVNAHWVNEVQVGEVDQDYYNEHPEARDPQFKTETELVVLHYDPGQLARARDSLAREAPEGAPMVGITAWETDRVPAAIAQQLSDLDLLIVPSQHTADAFRRSGLDPECPLRVVPHALHMPALQEAEASRAAASSRSRYTFYTIGTNIPRKNLAAIIAAYCRAFGPAYDRVGLVIKTSGDLDSVKHLYRDGLNLAGVHGSPRIPIYGDVWPADKIRQLHLQSNCWVDATRGEGFGLGQLEAAAMGNPVITTGWGAQTEVLAGSGIMRTLIDWELEPIDPTMAEIGVYQADQKWAEPSIAGLADAMRRAAMERWSKSLSQARQIVDRYSLQRIGKELAGALNSVKEA